MPGRMFSRSVKLELDTESDVYFLPPRQKTDSEISEIRAMDDNASSGSRTLLTGTATLAVASSKQIDAVQVDLVARHMVLIDGFQHHYSLCLGSYRIEIDEILQPGRHSYSYIIAVPWNAAPSEQSSFGRTFYRVRGNIVNRGGASSKRDSAFCPITLVPNHCDVDGNLPDFCLNTTVTNKALGQVFADIQSNYLVVSGCLDIFLSFPAPLAHLSVENIKVTLEEKLELQSLQDVGLSCTNNPTPVPVWSMRDDKTRPVRLHPGEPFQIAKQVRLPDENTLRPTTPVGAVTGVKVSHRMAITVLYVPLLNNPDREAREFRIACNATVSSCMCTLDAMQLPVYTKYDDVHIASAKARRRSSASNCLCSKTKAEVLASYSAPSYDATAQTITPMSLKLSREPTLDIDL